MIDGSVNCGQRRASPTRVGIDCRRALQRQRREEKKEGGKEPEKKDRRAKARPYMEEAYFCWKADLPRRGGVGIEVDAV